MQKSKGQRQYVEWFSSACELITATGRVSRYSAITVTFMRQLVFPSTPSCSTLLNSPTPHLIIETELASGAFYFKGCQPLLCWDKSTEWFKQSQTETTKSVPKGIATLTQYDFFKRLPCFRIGIGKLWLGPNLVLQVSLYLKVSESFLVHWCIKIGSNRPDIPGAVVWHPLISSELYYKLKRQFKLLVSCN